MKSRKLFIVLTALLLALLAGSLALNFLLYNYSKRYYLQLNGTRLDPLGLDYFSGDSPQAEMQGTDTIDVVFFGDSRAAEWPSPTIEGFNFVNRGIGAQTSVQVVQRYEYHVSPLQPEMLVLQVCINDLKTIPLFPERKEEIISNCEDNIKHIVQLASEQGILVILSTIIPAGPVPLERKLVWSEDVTLAIDEVNRFIRSSAGANVIVFDAFMILADEKGKLREEYSRDELHLKPAGYEALNQELVPLLRSLNE